MWTIQVARGIILTVLVLLFAYPMALFYGEPQLFPLVAVAGLTALISGLTSVSRYTEQRRLKLKRIALLELFSQLFSVAVVITWATFSPTVWPLGGSTMAYALAQDGWTSHGI